MLKRLSVVPLASLSITVLFLSACGGHKAEMVSYSKQVRPILEKNCLECHLPGGKGEQASCFNMENYDTFMKGTRLGPVVVGGSAVSSTLFRLVSGLADESIRMPHDGRPPLSDQDIATLKGWIDQGAKNN